MPPKDNDTTSEILDSLDLIKDSKQLQVEIDRLAENPFISMLLRRLQALELEVAELNQHEHNNQGDILIRRS